MRGLKVLQTELSRDGYWNKPINDGNPLLNPEAVAMFDQNGYNLTYLEKEYAAVNGNPEIRRSSETVLRQDWMVTEYVNEGVHINHCDLFERKGYTGGALVELEKFSELNPLLWKLIKLKPKWGIDFSVDFVDRKGNVFEVFHYEWDHFDYSEVMEKKEKIEDLALFTDWNDVAKKLYDRKDEWAYLDFFAQSKWKTDYFNLEPEKFKDVIWSS